MAYPFNESFDTGIPSGFGTVGGAGGVTATWNSTAQAVDLVFGSSQSFWKITAAAQSSDFWFEMDVEVTATTGTPHFGFWLWDGLSTYEGHRVAVLNYYWNHSFWNSSGAEYELMANGYAGWAVVGGRRTVRLDAKRSDIGIWQYRLTVDGTVVWVDSKRWYSTFLPCVFGYGTTVRLHRAAGGTPSALSSAPAVSPRGFLLRTGRRILSTDNVGARETAHRGLKALTIRRNHYYQGRYRIAGTVKQKGSPTDLPVSRRVLLIDERANFVVRETWSDAATGAYSFEYINPDIQYLVIAYDYLQNYRAAVADNLTAESMS